jgi:hypothetical protein
VGDRAAASLGDDDFGAALGAAVSFAYLICHRLHLFIEFTSYYMPAVPLLSKLAAPDAFSICYSGDTSPLPLSSLYYPANRSFYWLETGKVFERGVSPSPQATPLSVNQLPSFVRRDRREN